MKRLLSVKKQVLIIRRFSIIIVERGADSMGKTRFCRLKPDISPGEC